MFGLNAIGDLPSVLPKVIADTVVEIYPHVVLCRQQMQSGLNINLIERIKHEASISTTPSCIFGNVMLY